MKTIYTLAALAILATAPAHAAVKGCWQATGNWNVGASSYTNCEGTNDGHSSDTFVATVPADDEGGEEGDETAK